MEHARKLELLESLVAALCDERGMQPPASHDADELWSVFRALVNTRPQWPAAPELLVAQDELLQGIIGDKGIHTLDRKSTRLNSSHPTTSRMPSSA